MKINSKQSAPIFTTKDFNGNSINLSDYKGKKVLLSFNRNVGCPICNLRFHEIEKNNQYFKEKDLVILSVYESSSENMKNYLDGLNIYSKMLPNPEQNLYVLYGVEKSMSKVMKGMLNGAMSKMNQGKKLFNKKIKQDGNINRIGADFLIDEKGNIVKAYYGNFVGDHLPIEEIKEFLN